MDRVTANSLVCCCFEGPPLAVNRDIMAGICLRPCQHGRSSNSSHHPLECVLKLLLLERLDGEHMVRHEIEEEQTHNPVIRENARVRVPVGFNGKRHRLSKSLHPCELIG